MGCGRQDAADRLDHQEQRRGGDEGALRQARQRLGLAMAEAMLGIGRGQRLADGDRLSDEVKRSSAESARDASIATEWVAK